MDRFNVKIETLTNENYPIWEMQVEALLDSKGLYDDVILKDEPVKTEGDPISISAYNEWHKKNKEAYSLIILSISPEIAIIYKGIKNAKTIWSSLKERFEGVIEDKVMNLYLQMTKLRKLNQETIDQYITRAQGLSSEITQLGKKIDERELVRYIVEGLPEKYNPISATLIVNRGITLSHLRQILLDFEKKLGESKPNVSAFRTSVHKNKICYICRKSGHLQKQCWYNPQNKRNCNKNKVNKKPFNRSEQANLSNEHEENKEFALFTHSKENINETLEWHLDSACTSHMTCNNDFFVTKEECCRTIKTAEDNRCIESQFQGDILVSSEDDNTPIKLEKVLYVPNLRGNLLSVSSIVEKGNKVYFDHDGVKIYSKDNILLCKGKINEGLFTIKFNPRELSTNSYCFKAYENLVDLWHKRLGHINENYLQLLEKYKMVVGIDELKGKLSFCNSCLKGKIPRNEGSYTYEETTTNPLERIHVDICGPMRIETLGGRKYMMVIVDQYTRRYFVTLLFTKNEVTKELKNFIERRENETNLKVKKLRTDNGTEFINEELEDYLKNKGIKHEKTVPYSPRSNGVVERANRTILDMARSMLIEAKLPLSFWGEAVNTAAYLYNITPTKAKSTKTPLELWSGKKPSVKHIRTFGCSAIYKVNNPSRHKLEPKGREGILVGYSCDRKAYRIYSIEEEKVYETNDVTFNEDKLGIPNKESEEEYHFFEYDRKINPEAQGESFSLDREVDEENISEIQQSDDTMEIQTAGILPIDPEIEDDEQQDGRRIMRSRKQPEKFKDYVVYGAKEELPTSYEDAIKTPENESWIKAMTEELGSMEANEVWSLVQRPKDVKVIKSRWIFSKKQSQDNLEPTYKARLVAAGYNQQKGRDYEEDFSPVMRLATFRALLSIAVCKNYKVRFFDVKSAYLNARLENPVYLEQPPGFNLDSNKVCLVNKSIYGLPQSGRCWYEELCKVLSKENLTRLKSDPCIYTYKDKQTYIVIAVYVDDIMVISNTDSNINDFITRLSKSFTLREVTEINKFLGIEVKQESERIILSQRNYITKILNKFGMMDCNPVKTPGAIGEDLNDFATSPPVSKTEYQEALGSLMYLATGTRPDLAFAVCNLSQYNKDPREKHWKAIKRVFRYIKGTQELGLIYSSNNEKLNATSDASWCTTRDGRSFGGYFIKFGKNVINWKCSKQRIVALSTMEAELLAFCDNVCEIKWFLTLLKELNHDELIQEPVVIKTDSQALISWIKNPRQNSKSRHINRKYFFVKDEYEDKHIIPAFVYSEEQEADILTKNLPTEKMKHFLIKLSIRN